MAATSGGAALTEAHRRSQIRIAASTVLRMRAVWRLLSADDLDGTIGSWLAAAIPVVLVQRAVSEQTAQAYLSAFRVAEIGSAPPQPAVATPPDMDAIRGALIMTGPGKIRSALISGAPLAAAERVASTESARSAMRHALDGGRGVVTHAGRSDSAVRGWARVTSGNPCAFCAMLAVRGAAFSEPGAAFAAHAGCSCSAEPVYRSDSRLTPVSADLKRMWDDSTGSLSGRDALNAFRGELDRSRRPIPTGS